MSKAEADLRQVRAEIDKLDASMLSLIESRIALASKVASAKGNQSIFRPGREADLINHLIAQSPLPSRLIEQLWRLIIAHNLTRQADLKIAILDSPIAIAAAQFRFGEAIESTLHNRAENVISAVAKGKADLGILPHWQTDKHWLRILSTYRQQGEPVYIAATSHLIESPDQSTILSRTLPDPSLNDITMTMIDSDLTLKQGHHDTESGLLGIFQKSAIS